MLKNLDVINVRKFKDIDDIQIVLVANEQLYSTNLKALVKQIIAEKAEEANG